jgi:predicted flap endonuclease-1-like 5' DNA nuclease
MEVGLFVLGVLVGVGLTWYLLERYRRDETAEREANFNARVAALQDEIRESDAALAETKDRLISLQMEHRAAEARAKPMDAEIAQAKRAAEQAIEQEMRQRELNAQLQDELAALKRARGGKDTALAAKAAEPAPASKAAAKGPDDLTVIKGIGKVIERKLHELGISSFSQLAAMTPDEVHKVNEAIEFPGRVERENWIEQARQLARS